jgi:iron-sulfur cluster assembly accessory protein
LLEEPDNSGSLENKLLKDFHGNPPIIDSKYAGVLPVLTAKAQLYVVTNMQSSDAMRFYVDSGGCAGFNYIFDVITEEEVTENDIIINKSPLVFVDKESLPYVYGSVIDLVEQGINKHLAVNNPGAKASCGCGTSFSYDFKE